MTRPTALATALVAAVALGLAVAVPTGAQTGASDSGLDRVEALVASAEYDEARAALSTWWDSREAATVSGGERARALMLRARLASDAAAAEADYLAIVLGYPVSSHAPQALLRLGQALLATGEPARAAAYLQQLIVDHPGRPERTTGLLWLARARAATRQFAAACHAAREGLRDGDDADLVAMLRTEESAACTEARERPVAGTPRGVQARPPAAETRPADPPVTEARPAEPPAPAGRFAVQLGAFRNQPGVDALMARLREAGHEPRAVLVPANDLVRVRVGRFQDRAEATRLLARIRGHGFDAILVGDADRERRP